MVEEVQQGGGERGLVQADRHAPGLGDRPREQVRFHEVRQDPYRLRDLPAPRGADRPGRTFQHRAQVGGVGQAVRPRQCGLGEELAVGQDPAGLVGCQGLGELAVDAGLARVVQAQFHPGAEGRLDGDAHVVPAEHPGDDVDAVTPTAFEDVPDRVVQLLEVVAQRPEAVDDEDDLGGRQLRQPSCPVQGAQLLDGVDAVFAEEVLACGEHAPHHLDRAGGALAVGASGDAADVRQAREGLEAAADQVEAVDADLLRGVGERQGQDQGAQQGGLAGLGSADQGGVAARHREVQVPPPLPLLGRIVEQAERDLERAAPPGELHAARTRVQGAGGPVEGDGVGQRRQPDAADRCRGGLLQLADDDAHLGRSRLAAPRLRLARVRSLGVPEGVVGLVRQGQGAGVLLVGDPGGTAVGAGDVTGLETLVVAGVDLEVAEAGQRRQVEGVGGVQDRPRLVGGEGTQAEPVGEIGVQALELAAFDALAGQQEVDADGAPDTADGQEQVDEVRLRGEQFTELVDDDEEVGQRFQIRPLGGPQRGVVPDVGDVARVLEGLLAAFDLPGE